MLHQRIRDQQYLCTSCSKDWRERQEHISEEKNNTIDVQIVQASYIFVQRIFQLVDQGQE